MDSDTLILNAIESLEAQLESLRECVRLKQWEKLDLLGQSICRGASFLTEAISIAELKVPTSRPSAASISLKR